MSFKKKKEKIKNIDQILKLTLCEPLQTFNSFCRKMAVNTPVDSHISYTFFCTFVREQKLDRQRVRYSSLDECRGQERLRGIRGIGLWESTKQEPWQELREARERCSKETKGKRKSCFKI